MTENDRLLRIDTKLDALIDVVHEMNTENVRAHALTEGQELDERVTRMEHTFWPAVGAVSVITPVLSYVLVSWLKG